MTDEEALNSRIIIEPLFSNDGTFVTLPFQKPRKWKGEIKLSKNPSHNLTIEEYEKTVEPIVNGKEPTTLEELYYAIKLRGKSFPITIKNKNLIVCEIEERTIKAISPKHEGISFDTEIASNAFNAIMDSLEKKDGLFNIDLADEDAICDTFSNNLTQTSNPNRVMFKFMEKQIKAIREELELNPVKIISGAPGTGKTQLAISEAGDCKVLVLSLSNVVGANFCARATGEKFRYSDYQFWSYTKAHVMLSKVGTSAFDAFDKIVFEEASMLSSTEFSIVLAALRTHKPIWFLGDTYQLPGFLGLGNLFHSMIDEFPEYVKWLTYNYRAEKHPNLVSVFNEVQASERIPRTQYDDVTQSLASVDGPNTSIDKWLDDVEKECDTFACAFREDDVIMLNNIVLSNIFGIRDNELITPNGNRYQEKVNILHQIDRSFSMVCVKNLKSTDSGYLAFNGERFVVTPNGNMFDIQSVQFRDHSFFRKTAQWLATNFEFGYAMTIHKLQGSEADTVLYYEPKLNNFINSTNLRYVGLSRARQKLYIAATKENHPHFLNFNNIFKEI